MKTVKRLALGLLLALLCVSFAFADIAGPSGTSYMTAMILVFVLIPAVLVLCVLLIARAVRRSRKKNDEKD